MSTKDLAKKYGVSEEWIEHSASEYESGSSPHYSTTINTGSHLDAVGTKRVTVIYNSEDVMSVNVIARSRGVKSSEIYRVALRQYLDSQLTT
jgi:hypothetical protein